eukprot:15475095-Alexandrium_andersonii.AAC.1
MSPIADPPTLFDRHVPPSPMKCYGTCVATTSGRDQDVQGVQLGPTWPRLTWPRLAWPVLVAFAWLACGSACGSAC